MSSDANVVESFLRHRFPVSLFSRYPSLRPNTGLSATEISSPINNLMRLIVIGYKRIVFSIFLYYSNHRVHSLLNLADLRMHFLNKVVLEPCQIFDSFALRVKLS